VHLSIFISVFKQIDSQNLFYNKFYFMPLNVSSTCAHHREFKIVLHSLCYHHTVAVSCTRHAIKLIKKQILCIKLVKYWDNYITNFFKWCNTKQSIYYSASSLYVFRVSITPIIRSTQNCNHNLRYWYSLQYGQASMAILEGGSCTKKILPVLEAVVTILCTPDDGYGWHPKHVEWTCRITNIVVCVASRWTDINIDPSHLERSQLGASKTFYTTGTDGFFAGVKATVTWSRPLTPI